MFEFRLMTWSGLAAVNVLPIMHFVAPDFCTEKHQCFQPGGFRAKFLIFATPTIYFRPRGGSPSVLNRSHSGLVRQAISEDDGIDREEWHSMARDDGPVSVCVINLKGGVGKSTICALLARRAYLKRNLDVLAIDLDPQANLSQALHSDYTNFLTQRRPSIVEIFNGYRPPTSRAVVLVPVKPEYFATIGFPLLQQSLANFRNQNRAHNISVCGVVINNAFYHGGNDGGPEKARALVEINAEAKKNGWSVYDNQIPHSRGFPKIMRGDHSYSGNATLFRNFANEFFRSTGL
jgi:hypothetical protein